MRLRLVRAEQMHDVVAADGEELGDEAAVAAPPEGLGAEESTGAKSLVNNLKSMLSKPKAKAA